MTCQWAYVTCRSAIIGTQVSLQLEALADPAENEEEKTFRMEAGCFQLEDCQSVSAAHDRQQYYFKIPGIRAPILHPISYLVR